MEQLDYFSKVQAIGKTKKRVLLKADATSYISGQSEPEFNLKGQRPGIYADIKNAVIHATFTKTDASGVQVPGSIGVASFANRITFQTSGTKDLSRVENYNVLLGIKSSENFSDELLDGQFAVAYGTSSSEIAGATLAASGASSLRRSIPIALCGLAHQYSPLDSSEDIRLRWNVESALLACQSAVADAVLVSSSVTITNVQLCYDEYSMENNDYQMLLNSLPNKTYKITNTDFYHQYQLVPAVDTAISLPISLSKQNVKALYFCLRTVGSLTSIGACSLTSRNKAGITSYYCELGGSPMHGTYTYTTETSCAESMIEAMKASGGILDTNPMSVTQTDFVLVEGNATTNALCGKFFGKIDFTNGFNTKNSTIDGISINNGSLVLNCEKIASTDQQRLDCWTEYYSQYEMSPGGQWSVYG